VFCFEPMKRWLHKNTFPVEFSTFVAYDIGCKFYVYFRFDEEVKNTIFLVVWLFECKLWGKLWISLLVGFTKAMGKVMGKVMDFTVVASAARKITP
jgi:hypothetical protein